MRRYNRHRFAGFSLVEVLVVVAIIGILSAALIPTLFRSTGAAGVRDAARRVGDMTAFCQSMAISELQPFRLVMIVGEDRLWVAFERDREEAPGVFVPYGQSGYSSFRLPEGAVVKSLLLEEERVEEGEEAEDYIEFRRDGTADTAWVVIRTETEEAHTIVVDGLTGRIRIVPYDLEEMLEETDDSE